MSLLQSFSIYLAVFVINILLNLYFYYGSRKNVVYKYSSVFWCALFADYVMQAIVKDPHGIALSHGYYFLANASLVMIFGELLKINVNQKLYVQVMGSLMVIGSFGAGMGLSFAWVAMIVVIGINFPIVHFFATNAKYIWKNTLIYHKIFIACLFINTLHLFDFPFLRLNLDFALNYGFPFNFLFALICSFMLYILSDGVYIKNIERRLTLIIEERNELFKIASISEIVMGISHELNNNLQIIMFQSELMKETDLNSEQKNNLEKVDKSLARINQIIQPIRSAASIKKDVFLVEDLFSEVKSLLQENEDAHSKLSVSFEPKAILGSKHILIQVILNLFKSLDNLKDARRIQLIQQNTSIVIQLDRKVNVPKNAYITVAKILANKLNLSILVHETSLEILLDESCLLDKP